MRFRPTPMFSRYGKGCKRPVLDGTGGLSTCLFRQVGQFSRPRQDRHLSPGRIGLSTHLAGQSPRTVRSVLLSRPTRSIDLAAGQAFRPSSGFKVYNNEEIETTKRSQVRAVIEYDLSCIMSKDFGWQRPICSCRTPCNMTIPAI
jgi:hypothetical protein